MNAPHPSPITPSRDADLSAARDAMTRWQSGSTSGDWSRLLEMLHPDVTFHVPVLGFSGIQRGVPAAARFFDHLTSVLRADLRVTSVLGNGPQVGFEVDVDGRLLDEPFVQRLCIVFVVHDGLVQGFHEYLAWPGGLAPDTGARAADDPP